MRTLRLRSTSDFVDFLSACVLHSCHVQTQNLGHLNGTGVSHNELITWTDSFYLGTALQMQTVLHFPPILYKHIFPIFLPMIHV